MNKTWTIIITIVITIAVGIGSTYAYMNSKLEDETKNLQNQIDEFESQVDKLENQVSALQSSNSDSDTTTSTETVDETSTWETYTNDEYGFSFKYPGDFEIGITTDMPGGPEISLNPAGKLYKLDSYSINLINLNWHQSPGESTTLSDFVLSISADSKINTKVGVYDAVLATNINSSSVEQVVFDASGIIASFYSRIDMLLAGNEITEEQADEFGEIFDELLQTFEYTD